MTRDSRFAAYISREEMFTADRVRLLVRERRGSDAYAFLCEDGSWRETPDYATLKEAGIVLPAEAIEAVAVAIAEFQGHASHADTEARVLREWLSVERARVDAALGAAR